MNRKIPNIPIALLIALLLPCALPCAVRADSSGAPKPRPAPERRLKVSVATPAARAAEAQGPVLPAAPRTLPAAGHTTIAPFPVPGDTSRASAERMKLLNVPKHGQTTIAPIPPPAGVKGGVYFGPAPGPVGFVPPQQLDHVPPRVFNGYPEPLYLPPPGYPERARDAGIQGTVWVRIHVLENGSVGETEVARSIPALDSTALECAKRMRFAPPLFHGKPTTTWFTVPVKFTIH